MTNLRIDIALWTVTAKSGEIGTGSTPAKAMASLAEKLPARWVDITHVNVVESNSSSQRRQRSGIMAVETVKQVTSDLTGKVIAKDDDVVKVSISFPKTRKRFELDASADDSGIVTLLEKASEVQVRGRKPSESNGKPASK